MFTSGMVEGRRPPKRMAVTGTPLGSSHSLAITGHWTAGAVKREFGWAALMGSPVPSGLATILLGFSLEA